MDDASHNPSSPRDAPSTSGLTPIRPHALTTVRATTNERTNAQHEVPTEYLVALTVHLQNILRNKRCLLAYMQVGTH